MKCNYCTKTINNIGSLKAHEMCCKQNPNKVKHRRGINTRKVYIPWNKGKKGIYSNEYRQKISNSLKGKATGKALTAEGEIARKQKISESMKKNPNAGGLREGSGRGLKTWYDSKTAGRVYLRSTYELAYAQWLDENNINWIANKKFFEYEFEGQIRKYYPDFYLIDTDCYIEIKGYKTVKDEMKWKCFNGNLNVLYYNDLVNLGIDSKLLGR